MFDDQLSNAVSQEMGANYVSISSAWDSDNNYDVSNISLDQELMLLDAKTIYDSLSYQDSTLRLHGDEIKFRKDGNTYKPKLARMETLLQMKYRLAIASYLLKHCQVVETTHDKEWSIYKIVYKNDLMTIGVLTDGKACFFNFMSKEDKKDAYYKTQFRLKTRHTESQLANYEDPDDKSEDYYGDPNTSFPLRIDDMEDKLDDAIDLVTQASKVPELQHKIEELKQLLNLG